MPTYDKDAAFLRDWDKLTSERRRLFMDSVAKMLHDMGAGQGFRPGLRVKGVQGHVGVFEMTWEPESRATFSYGMSPHPGDVRSVWRRVGGHEIFQNP